MIPPLQLSRWLRILALLVIAAAAAEAAWVARRVAHLPRPDVTAVSPPEVSWPAAEPVSSADWALLRTPAAASAAAPGAGLAARYRLAGTFLLTGLGTDDDRRAVLDDLPARAQFIVGEQAEFEGVRVLKVLHDRVILLRGTEVAELTLSFQGGSVASASPAATNAAPETVLETSRFGKRVGEARWVFSRDELMKYYREILDDPERIAKLYLSMKPDYDEQKQVKGYYLDVEGEGEFFKAVGFQPGDIVRKVNSMNMTSQRRAELFIGQFVKNQLNTFVLDIERGGKPEKLVYLLR